VLLRDQGNFEISICGIDLAEAEAHQLSVEEIADSCLRRLQINQQSGPYYLIGHGNTALFAYELAYQLIGLDQDVRFLGWIDGSYIDAGLAQHYIPPPLPLKMTLPDGRAIDRHSFWMQLKRGLGSQGLADADLPSILKQLISLACKAPRLSAERNYEPLLTLQQSDSGQPPVFCIPGAGASVTSFVPLAIALGKGLPMHGFQPRGLCDDLIPHINVTSAAACYVRALIDMIPDGPFHLVGHSYGGWVALEMAHQLQAIGRRTRSITMLDSRLPSRTLHQDRYCAREKALERLVELYEQQAGKIIGLKEADFCFLTEEMQLQLLHRQLIAVGILSEYSRYELLAGVVRVFHRNFNCHYSPNGEYTEPLHIVAASSEEKADVLQWQNVSSYIQKWTSPGNHMTLLTQPNVDALADYLRHYLM
jgi:thioesterase domain-containing protein